MFGTVLIGSNALRLRWLQELSLATKKLLVVRTYDRYPSAAEAFRKFRPLAPTLVLLDFDERVTALETAQSIHAGSPGTAIIALQPDAGEHFDVADTGIVCSIAFDSEPHQLDRAVEEAIHQVQHAVNPNLITFLPAKAGAGCSTVVLNTATALHRSLQREVLVLEADLRSGVLSNALGCTGRGTIQNAFLSIHELDSFRWSQLVTPRFGVDWLLSDRSAPAQPPDWSHYFALLDYASPHYNSILVDLPELVNPGTAEILRSSGRVFVVTTQETMSLTLANQRFTELAGWGIPPDRIGVLLNRLEDKVPTRADVERLLQHPVSAVFPNDYHACQESISGGVPVSNESKLGTAFTRFAAQLIGTTAILPRPKQKLISRLFHNLSTGYTGLR